MESPLIVVSLGSKVIERRKFDREVVTIGRDEGNDIVINNLSVSRHHATIRKKDDKVLIRDLGSANGTFVNGMKIDETELSIKDVVLIGKHMISFRRDEPIQEDVAFKENGGSTVSYEDDGGTVVVDAETQEKFLSKLKGGVKVPKLILPNGREVEIVGYSLTIGKGDDSSLKIDGMFIKNPHARIVKMVDHTYKIISVSSFFKPTKVNGSRVREMMLQDGDIIKIGKHEMMFTVTAKNS